MDTNLKVDYFIVIEHLLYKLIENINRGLELRGLDASAVISIDKHQDGGYVVFFRS